MINKMVHTALAAFGRENCNHRSPAIKCEFIVTIINHDYVEWCTAYPNPRYSSRDNTPSLPALPLSWIYIAASAGTPL
jgi:hypothetical protein